MSDSVYKVVTLIGTSAESWEATALRLLTEGGPALVADGRGHSGR